MRQLYIAGNWKMNTTTAEAVALAEGVVKNVRGTAHKVMVAPPFTVLARVAEVLSGTNVRLGAQNASAEESGAHTGEVSVHMLKDVGVQTVILGHSERRSLYAEENDLINRKVRLALANKLEVILCVGETLEEREGGRAEDVVQDQLAGGLKDVSKADMERVVIAYEPVWAIGTGKTATPEDADAMHRFIRGKVADVFDDACAEAAIIQYGGSVKPKNAEGLLSMEHIDGALVGGASLDAESFAAIVDAGTST